MLNCRKVFEAMVKDSIGKNNMGETSKALQALIGEKEKTKYIDSLIKDLTGLLHLARHEAFPAIQIKRADAQVALHLTGALLAYLGSGSDYSA